MKLSHILSRTQSSESVNLNVRKHLRWISSPLEYQDAEDIADMINNEHIRTLELDEKYFHKHNGKIPHFKKHHESSTVELFYDLFFVANLVTFTLNHEITDFSSLRNYLGFFTLLWSTWLQTSLFDVRFSTDSIFNRVCKAISFGVMTGFAVCGAIYDVTNVEENVEAFRAMSLILMVSRLALAGQYAVILVYVWKYKYTAAPFFCTIGTLFLSATIYLGTFFGFQIQNTGTSVPAHLGSPNTYIAWYVVVCLEGIAIVTISCIWRVVSFKHTHLVERVGLLTLIVMGEGIIGMTKSVSQILRNSTTTSPSDIGLIIAGVLLVYFIWTLYFDQIEMERFGTIRQQIWAILHFPLHVGILLTVEGSSAFILWNIIVTNISDLGSMIYFTDPSQFPELFNSTEQAVKYLNYTLDHFSLRFKTNTLIHSYDYKVNVSSIANIKEPFGTTKWDEEAFIITQELYTGLTNYVFESFGVHVPSLPPNATELEKNNALYTVFDTVLAYFFIAAGLFLIVLAIMYWFGKKKKSVGEWLSLSLRGIAGVGVIMAYPGILYAGDSSLYFLRYGWPIPTITLTFFFVIVLDNLLVWNSNRTIAKRASIHGGKYGSDTSSFRGDYEAAPSSEFDARN